MDAVNNTRPLSDQPVQSRESSIYSEADLQAITRQINHRWAVICIPCAALIAALVVSLIVRIEWLTTGSTIAVLSLLIAAYDLAIKPLACYRRHLNNVLHGRVRESMLPFVAIGEDVNMVEGVACRAMTCLDVDGKGRPYDRLFYFDALKPFPEFAEGEMLRVVHHDLVVADVARA